MKKEYQNPIIEIETLIFDVLTDSEWSDDNVTDEGWG